MRAFAISGHCGSPQTADPKKSHERCQNNGHGNTANPAKEFQPCPCACHLGEEYECECGRPLREAPHLPTEEWDEDGEPYMRYVHVDKVSGNATKEECGTGDPPT